MRVSITDMTAIDPTLRAHCLNSPSGKAWKEVGVLRRAGVLVPLLSVYSSHSEGIGDFADIELLVAWAQSAGNSIIQLLPMNEVGSVFCPYDAVSSFALEPMYIRLRDIAGMDRFEGRINDLRKNFPAGKPRVDYRVKEAKLALLYEYYLEKRLWDSGEYASFEQENRYWLSDFALFKVLKNYFSHKPWYEWPVFYRNRDPAALEEFRATHRRALRFQIWLQWVAFKQFQSSKQYAEAHGVLMKGDLPILVSRDSADVWQHQDFFKLEFAAGAPVDMYCARGQRWGMPTYNGEAIAADSYSYIKERLRYAQNFYDLLRIDHVVGLFRIWSIPVDEPEENQGLNGFFDPRDESLWRAQGEARLSMMAAHTSMLLCAEDLGIIPPACIETLDTLGIPGNDVQRWVKDWRVRHDFLPPAEYRALSVAMLSTHDTTSWRGWWENEAGTVDEALFIRRCAGRVDYAAVKAQLFDPQLSRHGRLRWRDQVTSVDALVSIMQKPRQEIGDFIEMYENSFHEKEKLWSLLSLPGPMREPSHERTLEAALRLTYASRALFAIQLITDLVGVAADIMPGDAYTQRINVPGTVTPQNWSLVIPRSLEELCEHPVTAIIREAVVSSGRI